MKKIIKKCLLDYKQILENEVKRGKKLGLDNDKIENRIRTLQHLLK